MGRPESGRPIRAIKPSPQSFSTLSPRFSLTDSHSCDTLQPE